MSSGTNKTQNGVQPKQGIEGSSFWINENKWTWQNEISLAQRVTFYRTQSCSTRQAKRLAWDVPSNFSKPGQVWKPIMTIMARHTSGHWPILAQELTAEFRPQNKIHVSLAGWAWEVASLLSPSHFICLPYPSTHLFVDYWHRPLNRWN